MWARMAIGCVSALCHRKDRDWLVSLSNRVRPDPALKFPEVAGINVPAFAGTGYRVR